MLRHDPAPSSFRDVQRLLLGRVPGARAPAEAGAPLETLAAAPDSPRLVASRVIEGGGALRAIRVVGAPVVGFAAFLDGTQRSRVLHYHDGLPIVHGTVAAAVRVRLNRRLVTWARGPAVEHRVYLPRAYLPAALWEMFAERGVSVRDTSECDERGDRPIAHPLSLLECAVHAVQNDRERLEQALAEEWCAYERSPLFIDGGVSKSEKVATSACTAGVVKSHRTLYAEGAALTTVLTLPQGYRSSVFLLTPSRRTPVASWYLRLRDPAGRDPMWGLVRVEAARQDDVAARADLISRWILAEVTPLALPDGRWDKMVYGVRDCEEFLRAIC